MGLEKPEPSGSLARNTAANYQQRINMGYVVDRGENGGSQNKCTPSSVLYDIHGLKTYSTNNIWLVLHFKLVHL